jgi:hypothetical protein
LGSWATYENRSGFGMTLQTSRDIDGITECHVRPFNSTDQAGSGAASVDTNTNG